MVRPSSSATSSISSVTENETARGTRNSTAECVMPCLQQLILVLVHKRGNLGDFLGVKATAAREPDRIEPELRDPIIRSM
jgi:hypothetical protein